MPNWIKWKYFLIEKMSRQGTSSFSIDSLISSPFSSRFGSMMYNSGYVFMPPVSSSMLQYAQSPYGRFPLMPHSPNMYPGHFHSAFTNSVIGNYGRSDIPHSTFSEHVNKPKKRQESPTDVLSEDDDDEYNSHPKDLRLATTCQREDDIDEPGDDDVMSDDTAMGILYFLCFFHKSFNFTTIFLSNILSCSFAHVYSNAFFLSFTRKHFTYFSSCL